MERSDELEKFRKKLWLRFIALRKQYGNGVTLSFDQLWYDILVKHVISESPIQEAYEDVCTKLEQSCLLQVHDRDHK
jgi:hypothetical protein